MRTMRCRVGLAVRWATDSALRTTVVLLTTRGMNLCIQEKKRMIKPCMALKMGDLTLLIADKSMHLMPTLHPEDSLVQVYSCECFA